MILYFPSNISAKNYHNWIVYVNIIASRRWDVFFRHDVCDSTVYHRSKLEMLFEVFHQNCPKRLHHRYKLTNETIRETAVVQYVLGSTVRQG